MILAFVSLGEDNYNIKIEKLIEFLMFLYKYKVRYFDYIAELCLKLDQNNNGSIVTIYYYLTASSLVHAAL